MKVKIAAWISFFILRIIYLTVRWEEIDLPKSTEAQLLKGKGFLLALWHNQIPNVIHFTYKFFIKRYNLEVVPMASRSKDGELATRVISHFGMRPKRGSSKKGGSTALKALVQDSKKGSIGLITPDGPTGPIYELKPGIVQLASLTGFPVISYYAKYDRYWQVHSWDRTKVPKPFSKAKFYISEPFFIPKLKGPDDLQKWTTSLENFMLVQTGISAQEARNLREEIQKEKEARSKRSGN